MLHLGKDWWRVLGEEAANAPLHSFLPPTSTWSQGSLVCQKSLLLAKQKYNTDGLIEKQI